MTPGAISQAPGGARQGWWVGIPGPWGHRLPPVGAFPAPGAHVAVPAATMTARHKGSVQGEAKPSAPQAFLSIPVCKKHTESNRWGKGGRREERALNRVEGMGKSTQPAPGKGIGTFRCRYLYAGVFMDILHLCYRKEGLGHFEHSAALLTRLQAPSWVRREPQCSDTSPHPFN